MVKGLISRLFGGKKTAVKVQNFPNTTRTTRVDGIFQIDEVKNQFESGYLDERTIRAEGKVLEIKGASFSYQFSFGRDKRVMGTMLKIQNGDGNIGEVGFPIILLGNSDQLVGQRASYEYKREESYEGGPFSDYSHDYSLSVLSGDLSGKVYSAREVESY